MAEAGSADRSGKGNLDVWPGVWSRIKSQAIRTTKVYRSWAMNYQAMEPYEFLMFNTYGGGNNGGWSDGSCVLC